MEKELEDYVNDNIDECLDFSVFEEQGFEIKKGKGSADVMINSKDILFTLTLPLMLQKGESFANVNTFVYSYDNVEIPYLREKAVNILENEWIDIYALSKI